jgi:phytoene synthase
VAELDRDRILALSYVPGERRPGVEALWRLDAALGAVLSGGRDPLIARIKLAWWRETLERLDRPPPPAEPVLQALAAQVLPRGIGPAELAALEEAWGLLLSPDPLGPAELADYARGRGGLLFLYTARLLGEPAGERERAAGEAWALVDLARHSGDAAEAEAAREAAEARGTHFRWPPRLRPLGMLAMLAARDLKRSTWEEQGSPRRMFRMVRHRLTGR